MDGKVKSTEKQRNRVAGNITSGDVISGEKIFPIPGENPHWLKWISCTNLIPTSTNWGEYES